MRGVLSSGVVALVSVALGSGCLLPFGDELGGDDECVWDDECTQPSIPCQLAVCRSGACELESYDGPWPGAAASGCLREECVAGVLRSVPDATLADDGNACTEDLCRPDGGTEHTPLAAGTTCPGARGYCDALGVCQACAEDGDPCTVEDCSTGELFVETLPPGASCGDGRVCSPSGHCFECDDHDGCTDDSCAEGVLETTPRAPGSTCEDVEDGFCTQAGACTTCDDGDPCTQQECSSGAIVVTGLLAPGSACGDGDVCTPEGACVACDDGDPCTRDDCRGGIVTHTLEPDGTACADGGDEGTCDAGVCVTWCLPLPEPSTCVDPGPGEPGNDTAGGAVAYATDESADFPVCGRLSAGDAIDWYAYPASDDDFRYDSHRMRFWSYGATLRVCSFAKCAAGETEILSCTAGSASATGPEGEPGCCWEGVWRDESLVMDVECSGISDSPLVRMTVEGTGASACTPYALRGFSY